MSKSVFIVVLTAISYGEWIVGQPRSLTPPVPIAISSSQSLLLSFTPVQCMDTVNFIIVKVRVCYSFSKHNIFSTKAIESFIVVWIVEQTHLENQEHVSSTRLKKNSLTFASNTKTMQMALEKVAEVSYCYYSWDSREIVRNFLVWKQWSLLIATGRFGTFCPRPRADVFGRCVR